MSESYEILPIRLLAGSPGKAGPPGRDSTVPGPPGQDGKDGRDGIDGKDGVGKQGPPGKDGQNGKDGKDGISTIVTDQTALLATRKILEVQLASLDAKLGKIAKRRPETMYITGGGASAPKTILASKNAPSGIPPGGFFADNGVYIIGQAPTGGATVGFSAVSGAGVTMTFSAATLLGTAADVGRILTILDGTYKYATITTQVSTTVATVTLTGTLSGLGPFANNTIWLSGSPATNTTTFSVPLDAAYPGIWFSYPANAITVGAPAGNYWVVMASLTVGTVYNNLMPFGVENSAPLSPVTFISTGPGAFTQTTGVHQTLASWKLPGNTLGQYGAFRFSALENSNSSATTKTYRLNFGGTIFMQVAPATNNLHEIFKVVANTGFTNFQVGGPLATDALTVVAGPLTPVFGAIDTTIDQSITFTQQLSTNSTDWAILIRPIIELILPQIT